MKSNIAAVELYVWRVVVKRRGSVVARLSVACRTRDGAEELAHEWAIDRFGWDHYAMHAQHKMLDGLFATVWAWR